MPTRWVILLPFAGSLFASDSAAQAVLLRDANVVDPAAQRIVRASIVIDGDSILGITSEPPRNFRGSTIDLRGKWVMPGLFDGHVHSHGNLGPTPAVVEVLGTQRVAEVAPRAGVTGFLDLFGLEDSILTLRNRSRKGELAGADLYSAGTVFTAPGGHGTQFRTPPRTMTTPDEARRHVAEMAPKRPDVIKIIFTPPDPRSLDKATVEAIIEASRQRGIKTVVHVNRWNEALEAALAGANAITHFANDTVPDSIVRALRDRGVVVIPTITFADVRRFVPDSAALASPLLARVTTPQIIDAYRNAAALTPDQLARIATIHEAHMQSLSKLAAAGVSIMAGTDAGNPGVIQGFTMHRELELYVVAGLTPWQALASATVTPGVFLGARYGMRSGAVANLVVLSASPIEDIRNTQKIEMVFVRGKIVDGIGPSSR